MSFTREDCELIEAMGLGPFFCTDHYTIYSIHIFQILTRII